MEISFNYSVSKSAAEATVARYCRAARSDAAAVRISYKVF